MACGFLLLLLLLCKEKIETLKCNRCVQTSLALPPQGSGGNRGGLFRTPISGGVQNATSAHALPPPALAVRNLLEQVYKRFLLLRFYLDEKDDG